MKRALPILLALAIAALPVFAQEPAPKPEPKPEAKPEARAPEAEPLPSIDQILDKNIEAIGGKAALEKITSREWSGSFEIPAFNAAGTMQSYGKSPNKSFSTIDVPGFGTIRRGLDGTYAWEEDPMSGMRDISGPELAARRREADLQGALHMKDLYSNLAVKSKEKVGEKEAYVVEATPAEGKPEKLYFDVKSGLLIRHDAERESAQGVALMETYLDDYREVDGVKIPFSMRLVNPAFEMTLKISEVKNNVDIDDAKFKKPAPQQDAPK